MHDSRAQPSQLGSFTTPQEARQHANDATGGVRATPKAASADGAVPTTVVASTGGGGARITIVGDTATTTVYITVCLATAAVICDIARAAGADDGPPFDRDATLDTGGGASSRNVTAISVQTDATAATKDVTDDARRGARGKELGTRADSRVAAAATTVSPTPAGNGQPREEPPEDCCVCYEALAAPMDLLGGCPHRLHLPCYAALHVRAATDRRCPAYRATATVEEADRRALQQRSEEVMAEAIAVARREEEEGHPPEPHGTGGEGE